MGQPSGPIVGREAELAQLRNAVKSLVDVPLVIVEISGEAGIGKTTLLDWLAGEVRGSGIKCVRAAGSESEQDQAFGVLISLLDDVLSSDVGVAALDPYDVADLATVMPGLRSRVKAPLVVGPLDAPLLCRAVRRALTALAAPGNGLVVVVDDMHWVDEATASVLGYLIRHGLDVPILLASARRPTNRKAPSMSEAQARSAPHELIELIELGPIDRDDLGPLLDGVPLAELNAVTSVCGGNPFFVTQLAGYARSHAGMHALEWAGNETTYPPAVTAKIVGELASLPQAARSLAHAAAVLGDPFAVIEAGRLAQLEDTEAFSAIDDLLACALVDPVDDHGGFRFRHPIIASVIYEVLGRGWRLNAHARAARLLVAAGSDPMHVARHLESSAAIGDVAAIDLITKAAMDVRGLAPKTSARLLGSALRLIPPRGPLTERRTLLIATRADCLIRMGRFTQTREELLHALELVPAQDHVARATLIAACVRAEHWLGMHGSSMPTMEAALAQLPDGPSFERLSLEGMMLLESVDGGDVEQMRNFGRIAAASAVAVGEPAVVFMVVAGQAFCEAQIGSSSRALSLAEEAARIGDQLTEGQIVMAQEGLALLAATEQWLGNHESALRHASRGIECAQITGNLMAEMLLRLMGDGALTALGRLGSAAETIDDAEQIARMLNSPDGVCAALGRRGAVAALRGDWAAADWAGQECEAYLEIAHDPTLRALGAISAAQVLLQTGQPERCIELILRGAGGPELPNVLKPARAIVFEQLADAELARGDVEAARRWVDCAASSASDAGLAMPTCAAHRAAAALLMATGEPGAAVDSARTAVRAAQESGAPIEAARARMVVGQALAACGRRAEAVTSFELAREAFESCGARRFSAQVAKELRGLGVRTGGDRGARGSVGTRSLSAREHEVAELVGDGLTNPQIAQRLFLSPRTVESHLSRIFAKLGAKTRADVAVAIRRDRILTRSASLSELPDRS